MYVIAEVGQCHEGDMDRALKMIEAFAQAGCAAVKFQTFDPHLIAVDGAAKYWTDDFGTADQVEAFEAAGNFTDPNDWARLAEHAHANGIEFISTPFDLPSVELLAPLVDKWKIASGDITNRRLIEKVADTRKDVILSTGASDLTEVRAALSWIEPTAQAILLACSLEYPTPPERAHLGRIETLRRAFPGVIVGYSDHTTEIISGMVAAGAGAQVLEKHATWTGSMVEGGPVADHAMALDPFMMSEYVAYAWRGELLRGQQALGVHEGEQAARIGARRSLYAARAMSKGTVLAGDDVIELRPFDPEGISPADIYDVIGMTLSVDYAEGELLDWDGLYSPSY